MKNLYTYIILIGFTACTGASNNSPLPEVQHYGVLKEIMMEGQLQARVDLKELIKTPALYALGAMEELAGEILVLGGNAVNGMVKEGQLQIDNSFDRKAALLVSTQVDEWEEVHLKLNLQNQKELESALGDLFEERGFGTDQPVPFMIRGTVKQLDWHVINASEATERTHAAYKAAGLKGSESNTKVEILGFYSEGHQGVFTHHGSYLHMHFVNADHSLMGHVDELQIEGSIIILVPKTPES